MEGEELKADEVSTQSPTGPLGSLPQQPAEVLPPAKVPDAISGAAPQGPAETPPLTQAPSGTPTSSESVSTGIPAPAPSPAPASAPLPAPAPDSARAVHSVRLLDEGVALDAASFGIADAAGFTPSSVVLHGDVLYLANDNGTAASILRYDIKAMRALAPVSGVVYAGNVDSYNRLSDLARHGNRLYAASMSSNRVDVFDIADPSRPTHITTLGTGSWSSKEDVGLVHALAVAANSSYVFAVDITNRISVWKQSDVTAANNRKAIKHAFLALPGCGNIYCEVKLAATEKRLIASFSNGRSFAYDVSALAASSTPLQPNLVQDGVSNAVAEGDDSHIYVGRTSGGVDRFNADAVQAQGAGILPVKALDEYRQTSLRNEPNAAFTKARDLSFHQQRLAAIQGQRILVLPQRQITQFLHASMATVPSHQLAALPPADSRGLLRNEDTWEILTDPAQRGVYVNRLLSGSVEKTRLKLSSYSALEVKDLKIQARLKGSDQWFGLGTLDRFPAFSQLYLSNALKDGQGFPQAEGSGSFKLEGLDAVTRFPPDIFDIRIVSSTDSHLRKLNSIKPRWFLYFGKYDEPGKWARINPFYAREWIILMSNFAYMLSTREFEHLWFNHKKVMGHDFFGNAGQVQGPGGFFTASDYRYYYDAIMNRGSIRLGITTMGGGLGGGDVLGLDTWNYYVHYFRNNGALGHEFGHHFGSHDSAWANESWGMQRFTIQLLDMFLRKGELPYTDPNTNAFHLTPREFLYNGIDQNLRRVRPVSEINALEAYFAANPL